MSHSPFPEFSSAHVLIVGDVMLDRYWHGPTSRISPEAPVPVVHVREIEERPGGAGNVALNIARLGGKAELLAITGQDDAGKQLANSLGDSGVDCDFLEAPETHTITKLRVLSRHQQLIRLDFEDGFVNADHEPLLARFRECLNDSGVVILSDYGKGTLQPVQTLIREARAAGKPVLIDPKGSDFERYRGASLITPNLSEFETVVGPCKDEQELESKGMALIEQFELDALLVTRSEHGMSLLRRDHAPMHIPTRAQEVFDVTGAGDTVISVFAACLAAGESLERAMSVANTAAGIVVGKLGTAYAEPAELRAALHEESGADRVQDEVALLKTLVDEARARGEKIVITNGCFDILHAGHVSYLEEARRLGDRLIVAVNDDDSVRRLKGETRPINPLAQRMAVLAGLKSVDWVIPFGEDTPRDLICALEPDLLVKGGDYKPEEIAGYDCVTARGGDVVVLHFVDGCSTTSVINKIQQQDA